MSFPTPKICKFLSTFPKNDIPNPPNLQTFPIISLKNDNANPQNVQILKKPRILATDKPPSRLKMIPLEKKGKQNKVAHWTDDTRHFDEQFIHLQQTFKNLIRRNDDWICFYRCQDRQG